MPVQKPKESISSLKRKLAEARSEIRKLTEHNKHLAGQLNALRDASVTREHHPEWAAINPVHDPWTCGKSPCGKSHPTGVSHQRRLPMDKEYSKPSILAVLEHYGADVSRIHDSPSYGWQAIKCPFHDDRSASAGVNVKLDGFTCHTGCGSGDSWKLIQEREGVDFRGAVEWAKRNLGYASKRLGKRTVVAYSPSWVD